PFAGARGSTRGRRSKASVRRKPRGGRGVVLVGRDLWGFEGRGRIERVAAGAGGAQSYRRERRRRAFSIREDTRAWRERGAWRGSAEVVRTALVCSDARPEVKLSGVGGREDGDRDHEVSILIRFIANERAGRAPPNVSMMIIRPPQHGY